MNERDEYTAIMRRESTRYKNLPWWRVYARTKQMGQVRRAAANASYAGVNIDVPRSARSLVFYKTKRFFAHELTWLALVAVAMTTGGYFFVKVLNGGPPKPLAPGITQRGYQFIIPAGYAQRDNYEDADPSNLCDRIPAYGGYDEFHMEERRDGSIVITCDPDEG